MPWRVRSGRATESVPQKTCSCPYALVYMQIPTLQKGMQNRQSGGGTITIPWSLTGQRNVSYINYLNEYSHILKSSNKLIYHSGCNQQFIISTYSYMPIPKNTKKHRLGSKYNSHVHSIHIVSTSSLAKPHGRLGLRTLRQKELSTLE